jgi:hypothetical protein
MSETAAGWYSDPKSAYLYRYWNGSMWTEQVSNGAGHSGVDPDPLRSSMVATPPAPGTAAPATTAAPPPTVHVTQTRGSSFGTILAVVLAIIAIVVVIAFVVANSGDDSTDTPEAPTTTEAPANPGTG